MCVNCLLSYNYIISPHLQVSSHAMYLPINDTHTILPYFSCVARTNKKPQPQHTLLSGSTHYSTLRLIRISVLGRGVVQPYSGGSIISFST